MMNYYTTNYNQIRKIRITQNIMILSNDDFYNKYINQI